MVQAQQVLDGIQHKVESEIRKGMDCLAQAKAELQVCTPCCNTLRAVCCQILASHLPSVGTGPSHSFNAACCLTESSLHICSIDKVRVEQGISVCPIFLHWTALSIRANDAFQRYQCVSTAVSVNYDSPLGFAICIACLCAHKHTLTSSLPECAIGE